HRRQCSRVAAWRRKLGARLSGDKAGPWSAARPGCIFHAVAGRAAGERRLRVRAHPLPSNEALRPARPQMERKESNRMGVVRIDRGANEPVPIRAPRTEEARNPGIPLDLDWVRSARANRSAIERRAAALGTRRTVKKEWQVAWLLRAITCIDLTTLSGDDTPGNVRRLCAKARLPVRRDILDALGAAELPIRTAAVCVYHAYVETAVRTLEGSGIPVAAVSTGFPAG